MINQFVDITVAPVSVTISPYSSINFRCEGTGDTLTWTVESVSLTDAVSQQRNITVTHDNSGSTLSSVLTIIAIPINDGIEIGCIIVSFNPYQPASEEATLTIRG